MATSITHRATGLALVAGMIFLTWWLVGLASGPEVYRPFMNAAGSLIGQVVLFGFAWSLTYHFLNGVRHLMWDVGYGFAVPTANKTGVVVIALSLLIAIGIFVACYVAAGHGASMP